MYHQVVVTIIPNHVKMSAASMTLSMKLNVAIVMNF